MRLTPTKIRNIFTEHVNSLNPEDVAKAPGNFSRNRLCNFKDTLFLLMTMANHSLTTEITNFFSYQSKAIPSKSAFCQQRSKLSESALKNIFAATNNLFPFKKKFKGLHILAADGSDINIPSQAGEEATFTPYNSNKGGYHQIHLNAVYDILEKRYVDAIVTLKRETDEIGSLTKMVERSSLREDCLYIADRGYSSFNMLMHLDRSKQYYLIRTKSPENRNSFIRGIVPIDNCEYDVDHSFMLSRRHFDKSFDKTVFKKIKSKGKFDFIEPDDKRTILKLSLRVVKIRLSEDSFEYLLTNLPRGKFPPCVLKELYGMRWGVETSFRSLKYSLGLNFFHSRKLEFILQEVFAHLTMYNLISLLNSCIKNKHLKKERKYQYMISFADSVVSCRWFITGMISAKKLKDLLSRNWNPIKPNRSFQRKTRSQRVQPLNNRS